MEFSQLKQQFIDLNKSIKELGELNHSEKHELEDLLVGTIESYPHSSEIDLSSLIKSNKDYQKEFSSILNTIINYASSDFSASPVKNRFESFDVLGMAIKMLGEELVSYGKRTELAEETFQQIFSNSPLSSAMLDANLNVLSVNDEFCQFLGYSKDELVGGGLSKFSYSGDYKKDEEKSKNLYEGEFKNFTKVKRYVAKNGDLLWGEVSVIGIKDAEGNITRSIGMVKDISKEYLINQQIKESENLLKEAQRIGNFGHWQLDLVSNKLSWSDQQYVIWGIEKEYMEPSYEGFLNSIHPEDRDMVTEAYESSLSNKTPYSIMHRLLMKDGEIKYVRETCETKYSEKGDPLVSVGTTQDMTLEVLQEKKLQNALSEKEVLLKEVHHRVKNNLQIISGLLEMQSYRTDSDVVKKELGESKARIKSIALIHEQLYRSNDFSSVGLGEYVSQLLVEIASIYSLQEKLISVKNIISEINVDINKAIPIGLILNELITNATKHAFLESSKENLITIAASKKSDLLTLNITDNGVGFKVPFDSVHMSSMGVKMIKALIGQLEAECKVESDSSGTKFKIDIPL